MEFSGSKSLRVSTHSRPKAAAFDVVVDFSLKDVSTHSRPKAAAIQGGRLHGRADVSTHSRPKAAATLNMDSLKSSTFQHTAARRRLQGDTKPNN